MAKVISTKNLSPDLKYEPGFELKFGITDDELNSLVEEGIQRAWRRL